LPFFIPGKLITLNSHFLEQFFKHQNDLLQGRFNVNQFSLSHLMKNK